MADISKITALDGVTYNLKDLSKLEKTTYEYNNEISFGSSNLLCIGKFPCYDSNVSITIKSTTSITYYCVAILATQNINTSGGGLYNWKTYGDASNSVTPNLYAKYVSGSRYIEIYFSPQQWSKNLIHIQAQALSGSPTDICTKVSSIPSDATIKPTNTFGTNPKFTDTTYESKAAASGGTDVSLVTTGEKYIWNDKQNALVSGTNIKTVNGNSLLGSGNIAIEGGAEVVELTQAEYDALTDPDPDVVYFITDANDYNTDKMDVTLYAANWSSGIYTITDDHIGTDTVQLVSPTEGITDTQLEALQGANIQAYGQTTGELYLKAYGDVPEIDIPVSVIFHPGVQVRDVEPQKQDIYSTTEQVIGTWIDGKPLYRKSYFSTNTSISSGYKIDGSINTSLVTPIKISGTALASSGYYLPIACTGGNNYLVNAYLFTDGLYVTASLYTINEFNLVVEYTKITD